MSFTEQLTEALSISAADLPPANYSNAANAQVVGPINMSKFRRILGKISVGVMTGTANIQGVFQSSNANNGTFTNVASGPTATFANTNGNNCATLEMRSDQVPTGNTWVQLAAYVNANAAFLQAELWGSDSHYSPAKQFDTATVFARSVM